MWIVLLRLPVLGQGLLGVLVEIQTTKSLLE